MPDTILIYVGIALAAVILLVVLLKARGGKPDDATGGESGPASVAPPRETPASEPVQDEMVPDLPDAALPPVTAGDAGDELSQIKGLGPKAELGLRELGVVRFEQIAVWTEADIAAIDAKLGLGKRIERDRWIEQAQLLATSQIETFEAKFGKLG